MFIVGDDMRILYASVCAVMISGMCLFAIFAQEDTPLLPDEASSPQPQDEKKICNDNGVCDAGETAQDCPNECVEQDFTPDGGIPPFDVK